MQRSVSDDSLNGLTGSTPPSHRQPADHQTSSAAYTTSSSRKTSRLKATRVNSLSCDTLSSRWTKSFNELPPVPHHQTPTPSTPAITITSTPSTTTLQMTDLRSQLTTALAALETARLQSRGNAERKLDVEARLARMASRFGEEVGDGEVGGCTRTGTR